MKKKESCQLHSKSNKTVARTLISLLLFGFGLVFWHVFTQHRQTLFTSLAEELWLLLAGRSGILMEIKEVFLYFLVGIAIAGYIRTYKYHIRLRKVLNRFGFMSIFLASFVGVFSPLCSCGILTTVVALLAAGLPLAPSMALLISSPLMSPTAFFLTLNDLGVQWTIVRVLVAFLMGVLAGVVTHILSKRGFETENLFLEGGIPEGDFHDADYPDERLRCTCNEKFSNRMARKTSNKFLIFLAKTTEMLWLIGKYVLVGITIGCILEKYIPSDYIYRFFGGNNFFNPVWVTLGSIPLFLHQISASSILYHIKSSLPGLMDNRAALAFLIGGPVTAIPAMILLWSMFKKKVFFLYMAISIFGTLFFAYTIGNLMFVPYVDTNSPVLANVSTLSGGTSAVIAKSGHLVRIALAPQNKPIIATYEDSENGNGIVFDAGWRRFLDGQGLSAGNRQYLQNVAHWLRETSTSPDNNRIFVYNTCSNYTTEDQGFQKSLPSILKGEEEFEVDIFTRSNLPLLTKPMLEDYGQVWILCGQLDESSFSPEELQDIYACYEEGHSLFIVTGPQEIIPQRGTGTASPANQVAKHFGVQFISSTKFEEQIPISVWNHFNKNIIKGLVNFFRCMRWLRD